MKYRIVSDSSSNVFRVEDIDYKTVPLKVITAEGEFYDDERLNLQRFMEVLRTTKQKTSTSCPNAYEWMDAFDGADAIFAVTLTGALSGAYSAAVQAKEMFLEEHPEANILVIDSLSTGPEMQLIIEKLKDLILEERSFADICTEIREYQRHTHLLFGLESLRNLARNGRVSPAIAKISGLLGIRIVGCASDEGKLEMLHKCRGTKKTIDKIAEEMILRHFAGKKVRIAHAGFEEFAQNLKTTLLKLYPFADIQIIPCTALCTYYVEEHGILVGFEDSRN